MVQELDSTFSNCFFNLSRQISGLFVFQNVKHISPLHLQQTNVGNIGTLTNLAAFDCSKFAKIGMPQSSIVPRSIRRVEAMAA